MRMRAGSSTVPVGMDTCRAVRSGAVRMRTCTVVMLMSMGVRTVPVGMSAGYGLRVIGGFFMTGFVVFRFIADTIHYV